jgi:hypothetical protein
MAYRSVQGVTLEVDSYWSEAWFMQQALGKVKMERRLASMWEYWYPVRPRRILFESFRSQAHLDEDELNRNFFAPTVSDLEKWHPPFWKEYMHSLGEDSLRAPILVKVLLYPPNGDELVALPELEPTGQLMVEFEKREPGTLLSNPKRSYRPVVGGVSVGIGSSDYGTLGGIVKDALGRRYALTCAHVASQNSEVDQPAQVDSSSAARIGKRVRASVLRTCASTAAMPCACWTGGPAMNEVDAALIELDSAVSSKMEVLDIGQISGIRRNFMPPLAVEITGRSSRNRHLRIGNLVAAIRLADHKGNKYCFGNLLEIKWPSFSRVVLGRPIQSGDSGAWVCASSASGFDFLGMVVAGNRSIGYANLSRSIEDWWTKKEALSLSVS